MPLTWHVAEFLRFTKKAQVWEQMLYLASSLEQDSLVCHMNILRLTDLTHNLPMSVSAKSGLKGLQQGTKKETYIKGTNLPPTSSPHFCIECFKSKICSVSM